MLFKKISVIGLGYIGLPTAAMFASKKVTVLGIDRNAFVVDTINRGEIHIVEPFLDSMVHQAVKQGYLSASTVPEPADAFLIAVPTPFKNSNNPIPEPDLSYIESAI
jgi:UDP-N-acetyl-D-mannosaminuronic acid dehydrogenase